MRIISKVAAIALVLFALVPAVTAGAQNCPTYPDCVDSNEQDRGGSDAGGGAEADTGGRPSDAPAANDSGGSAGGPAAGPAGGPANAPTGALPITGGDVVGMATIGAVAIALGAVLVRRSKVAKQHPA